MAFKVEFPVISKRIIIENHKLTRHRFVYVGSDMT